MTDNDSYNAEATAAVAATDLGYKKSSNVTGVVIVTYNPGSTAHVANGTAGYCIDVTSASTKHFYYDSQSGGLTTSACA